MRSRRVWLGAVVALAWLGAGTAAAEGEGLDPDAARPLAQTVAAANPCGAEANPCNPCGGNPCADNPCGGATNPCNPCGGKANACNPCGANPCGGNPCGGANPCNPCGGANPCNPCGGASVDPARFQQPAGTSLHEGDRAELVALGEELWNDRSLGSSGVACSTCHANRYGQMRASFAKPYPHRVAMPAQQAGVAEVSAAEMVQFCMLVPMQDEPLPWDSQELAALTAYVEHIQEDFDVAMAAGGANPCGANPCNPCGGKPNACNPCGANPCGENPCGGANPCNPCGGNPCNPCGGEANACNPCGGS